MGVVAPVNKAFFRMPPKGALEDNGFDDPLRYYYFPFIGFLYRLRIKQALSMLMPPYKSILEIGYGSGILLPTFASYTSRLFGIDLYADAERVTSNLAKLSVTASLISGDIRHTNYSDNSFDLIVAISVFEHIHDPDPALNEVFRLLKPNGTFLVGMPRVDSLMKGLFSAIGYKNIGAHHVTNHKQFIKSTQNRFKLIKISSIPKFFPSLAGLYFNMLFQKSPPPIIN